MNLRENGISYIGSIIHLSLRLCFARSRYRIISLVVSHSNRRKYSKTKLNTRISISLNSIVQREHVALNLNRSRFLWQWRLSEQMKMKETQIKTMIQFAWKYTTNLEIIYVLVCFWQQKGDLIFGGENTINSIDVSPSEEQTGLHRFMFQRNWVTPVEMIQREYKSTNGHYGPSPSCIESIRQNEMENITNSTQSSCYVIHKLHETPTEFSYQTAYVPT